MSGIANTKKSAGVADVVNHHARKERAGKIRCRKTETDEAEIARALGRPRYRACQSLRRKLECHEGNPEQRRGEIQRRQCGPQERQHQCHEHAAGAEQQRDFDTEAIGHAAGRQREHGGQRRI
jgi:hypothetical protein